MPQIEHIEVGFGNYPSLRGDPPTKKSIFIITGKDEQDYVMEYTDTRIATLCNYMFNSTKLKFTQDGTKTDKRNIVDKKDKKKVKEDNVFHGCKVEPEVLP